MSHPTNDLIAQFRLEQMKGAYSVVIPEDTIYTDTYIQKQTEEKEREEMKQWDETAGDKEIY